MHAEKVPMSNRSITQGKDGLKRKIIVDNKWLRLCEDQYSLPNGSECTYYHVQKMDAVMAIAVDTSEPGPTTFIVNQFRHPISQRIWQFPIGGFDPDKVDPIEAAQNELLEETGVIADSFSYLGSFFGDPGFTNQKVHVCASSNILEIADQQLEDLEFGLTSKEVSVAAIPEMIQSGEMGDAWGTAGHFYLTSYLNAI
jgi:ADP-ribose pyrophosphatase YjhB (NUDIX family)